jgi:hypothetical protein
MCLIITEYLNMIPSLLITEIDAYFENPFDLHVALMQTEEH